MSDKQTRVIPKEIKSKHPMLGIGCLPTIYTMSPEMLIKHVLEATGQPNAMRFHKKKNNEYLYTRNIIAKILREEYKFTLDELGKLLKKNHVTIRHNINFMNNALNVKDPLITELCEKAIGQLLKEKEEYLSRIKMQEHAHDYKEYMNMLVCTICGHAKSIFD